VDDIIKKYGAKSDNNKYLLASMKKERSYSIMIAKDDEILLTGRKTEIEKDIVFTQESIDIEYCFINSSADRRSSFRNRMTEYYKRLASA